MLPKQYFTGDALHADDVALVHAQIQKQLISELCSLVKVAEDQFEDLSLTELVNHIRELDINRALSPHVFSAYQQLSECLDRGDTDTAKEVLVTLVSIEEWYGVDLE